MGRPDPKNQRVSVPKPVPQKRRCARSRLKGWSRRPLGHRHQISEMWTRLNFGCLAGADGDGGTRGRQLVYWRDVWNLASGLPHWGNEWCCGLCWANKSDINFKDMRRLATVPNTTSYKH
jgi:hypothetical protein